MTDEKAIPKMTDLGWSDYVIEQLDASELVNGNPKVDGLRRLTELLIGEIVSVKTAVKDVPTNDNLGRATVEVAVMIQRHPLENTNSSRHNYLDYTCAADVHARNADAPYHLYPVALAETRAFGRCLRQALRIKTVTAEEVSTIAETNLEEPTLAISEAQIKGISTLCKKLNINVQSFVNAGSVKYNSIKEVARSTATIMMKTLNEHQNNTRDSIPEKYAGYDASWAESFNV